MRPRPLLSRLKHEIIAPWLHARPPEGLTARFTQFVYDRSQPPSQFATKTFARLSRWLIRLGDPLVRVYLDGQRLWLPMSHRLPLYRRAHPYYGTNIGRIAQCVADKYPDLTLIDVGANIGDSLASIRQAICAPVLCVEGDAAFFSVLEKNAALFPDVYPARAFVGEFTEIIQAEVQRAGGTAVLSEGGAAQSVAVRQLSDLLVDHPAFRRAKLLKIDTDGFDVKVVKGAADFLASARPVVFFEYDPDLLSRNGEDGLEVFEILRRLEYRGLLLYENTGEFLQSAALDNTRLLEEMHVYYSGRNSFRYLDICAFHADDDDLFEITRQAEIRFSAAARTGR